MFLWSLGPPLSQDMDVFSIRKFSQPILQGYIWRLHQTGMLLFSHSVMSDSLQSHGLQHARLAYKLGASTGVPTHDEGHVERAWHTKVSQDLRGPLDLLEHLPQNQNLSGFTVSRLSPTPLTLTGGFPRPPFSIKNQLKALYCVLGSILIDIVGI